jgi:hypothetical protein
MIDLAPPPAPLEVRHNGSNDYSPRGISEWLSINAAARQLGVTATAIRNRIKRGTLWTRATGNFGRLVWVPLALARPITPTPEPASLVDHVASLKAALAKAEAEIATLKTALESEQGRLAEIQAERDRLLNRSWWRRLVG